METSKKRSLGFFERWLTLWVILCMLIGVGVGHFLPSTIQKFGSLTVAQVNLPTAILIWLMIIPMMMHINFREIVTVRRYWRGITITACINWLVKPFSMALLGIIFLKYLFYEALPPDKVDHYVAGLIILAAAPCTAMVFVWSYLCEGNPHFTLTQVALNDIIMIFAFAPIVGFLLGVTNVIVPWETLFYSVIIFIVVPVILAQALRVWLLKGYGEKALKKALKVLHPIALTALLLMLVLLFSFQGEIIIKNPLIVLLLAIPILVQVYFNSMLAYGLNWIFKESFSVAGPSALIGASNFFELAVATSISLFGLESGATLATVVGVLVEVPVMLSIVKIVNKTKSKYLASQT